MWNCISPRGIHTSSWLRYRWGEGEELWFHKNKSCTVVLLSVVMLWSLRTCFKSFSRVSSGLHASLVVCPLMGWSGWEQRRKQLKMGNNESNKTNGIRFHRWNSVKIFFFSIHLLICWRVISVLAVPLCLLFCFYFVVILLSCCCLSSAHFSSLTIARMKVNKCPPLCMMSK